MSSAEVSAWRIEGLGEDAAWEPTLIRVDTDGVRVWTGRSMIIPLVRHLGVKSSVAVTFALGSLRNELLADEAESNDHGVTRKRFLQLGAGALIAGTVMASGQVPAYAADPVGAWLKANGGKLPATYDEFSSYPLDYRRRIFQQLTPATRSTFWTEQLTRYRTAHPTLTAAQRQVLDEAMGQVAQHATFHDIARATSTQDTQFIARAKTAFGDNEAETLFATLGPAQAAAPLVVAQQRGCTCSQQSDYCGNNTHCSLANSSGCIQSGGCGTFYAYTCDGFCIN